MSLPQFTATTKLAETASTPLLAVVRAFNALVTSLQSIFTSLLGKVQLDSVILQNVSLVSGSNTIPHTLGRTLTGWSVIRIDSLSGIFETPSPDPSTYLVLFASDACKV